VRNRGELVDFVSRESGVSRRNSRTAVRSLIEILVEGLEEGRPVSIRGLGMFERVRNRLPKGKLPYRVVFRPSRNLKRRMDA